MRLNLIFGFLGSGKTTLLRRILSERAGDQPTAVIVNEFGDVGIDGDILQGNNVDMVQLSSGCVCCTLRGSLISAIEELDAGGDIERIVIEASGVAEPGDLLETLWDPRYGTKIDIDLGPVVAVVDTPKFSKIRDMLGDFYTHQVAHADVILLNKIDNAGEQDLDAVYGDISALSPEASLIFTEQCGADLDLVLDGKSKQKASHQGHHDHDKDHSHDHEHDHGHDHEHGHVQFDSLVLGCGANVDRERVEKFFESLDPTVFRAKGFMTIDGQPRLVQFATGQLDIHPADGPHGSRMVFIGKELDRQGLQEKFGFARGGEADG